MSDVEKLLNREAAMSDYPPPYEEGCGNNFMKTNSAGPSYSEQSNNRMAGFEQTANPQPTRDLPVFIQPQGNTDWFYHLFYSYRYYMKEIFGSFLVTSVPYRYIDIL